MRRSATCNMDATWEVSGHQTERRIGLEIVAVRGRCGRHRYLSKLPFSQGKSAKKCLVSALDETRPTAYFAPPIAPSSNGKTTDSDSVNRGSNPRGASSFSS